jgi:hypothetical protein
LLFGVKYNPIAMLPPVATLLALLPIGILGQVPHTARNIAGRTLNAVYGLLSSRIDPGASAVQPERKSLPSIVAQNDDGRGGLRGAH